METKIKLRGLYMVYMGNCHTECVGYASLSIYTNPLGIHSLKKVEVFGLWPPYFAYISVSKPTPWAVAGPMGS